MRILETRILGFQDFEDKRLGMNRIKEIFRIIE
jgi:hypothetical protein